MELERKLISPPRASSDSLARSGRRRGRAGKSRRKKRAPRATDNYIRQAKTSGDGGSRAGLGKRPPCTRLGRAEMGRGRASERERQRGLGCEGKESLEREQRVGRSCLVALVRWALVYRSQTLAHDVARKTIFKTSAAKMHAAATSARPPALIRRMTGRLAETDGERRAYARLRRLGLIGGISVSRLTSARLRRQRARRLRLSDRLKTDPRQTSSCQL